MDEDVVDQMTSLKLMAEEEEDIQVSEEGPVDELEGCVLSLIGKFLTCKPYNRKATKNTLRRAWGLEEGLQISEVGSNLFQFKFQSEYELNRILKGGPCTFDNQLLMLTRWKAGMSANNVALEHASLWIQIWRVPFDMMSPEVASEVGNKIGVVEDVERRWKTDDQKFFLRVRVALSISKPMQRGGFLLGSDGQRHWVTYKYELLPMFCHYCGILGHDLHHCLAHFAASKESDNVEYQYVEWLKVDSGWGKSPPRRSKENPMRSELMGSIDTPATKTATKIDEETEVMTTMTRALEFRAGQDSRNGNSVFKGSVTEIPESISVVNADNNSNVADTMPLLLPKRAGHQFLNDEANGKFSIITSSLGQGDAKPNKPKSTWTRLNRMDVGPLVSTNFKMESRTGKRGLEEVLNTDKNRDAKPKYYKRSKGDKEDGNAENTSAGVADHHCREQ